MRSAAPWSPSALARSVIGAIHLAVAVGISRRRRWALSAGVLLASVLCVAFVALAASAAASAVRETGLTLLLVGATAVAALAAIGYGLVAARLVSGLRSAVGWVKPGTNFAMLRHRHSHGPVV